MRLLKLAACLAMLSSPVAAHDPDCRIVGDSIAVGLSWHLKACPAIAKVGISSSSVLARSKPARMLIISAGSNDPMNKRLRSNLEVIRAKARAAIWIVPRHKRAASIVRSVAKLHSDAIVTFSPDRDGVHPKSYRALARNVAAKLRGE